MSLHESNVLQIKFILLIPLPLLQMYLSRVNLTKPH